MANPGISSSATSPTGPTQRFFDDLAERRQEPVLQSSSGTLRFDLVDGSAVEHWSVRIERGKVSVSRKATRADALVRLDRALFDRIVTGQENATAATLRGALVPVGDLGLVTSFQRLFPGPPGAGGGSRAGIEEGAR
jgi:putative sterol carrier protein